MQRIPASQVRPGMYLDVKIPYADLENGPDPSDCEPDLCPITRIEYDGSRIKFFTEEEVCMVPGDPSDTMEYDVWDCPPDELVRVWTEQEANRYYGVPEQEDPPMDLPVTPW